MNDNFNLFIPTRQLESGSKPWIYTRNGAPSLSNLAVTAYSNHALLQGISAATEKFFDKSGFFIHIEDMDALALEWCKARGIRTGEQATAEEIAAARDNHVSDDVMIDDDARVSHADTGYYVEGWLWVDTPSFLCDGCGDYLPMWQRSVFSDGDTSFCDGCAAKNNPGDALYKPITIAFTPDELLEAIRQH